MDPSYIGQKAPMKTEKIREYYLLKLREAEEKYQRADGESERETWRRIVLGYQYLVDLPRVEVRDQEIHQV